MAQFHFPSHGEPKQIKTSILYWVLNTPEAGSYYATHCHPFWQVEIVHAGEPELEANCGLLRLHAGDMVFIPPFLNHRLSYPTAGIAYCSIKCEVDGLAAHDQPIRTARLAEFPLLRGALEETLGNIREVTPEKLIIATNVLTALLTIQYAPGSPRETATRLRRAVQDQINQNSGVRLGVQQIARRLGYSRNHLSVLFHREAGETLKSFVDRVVCRNAEKLITYSAMNVSEIADALGFHSIYTFSRFFKRINGRSPTDFRRQADLSGEDDVPKSPGMGGRSGRPGHEPHGPS